MMARPFSRLEPVSRPDDPARAIAAFFAVISAIGAIPGAYGGVVLGSLFLISLGSESAPAGGSMALGLSLAFVALGFRQLAFYCQRALGKRMRRPDVWWATTYMYNLVPLGLSIAAFLNVPHIAAGVATLWFATLCTLAVVAYAAESRRLPVVATTND